MNVWMVVISQGRKAPDVIFYDPSKLSERVLKGLSSCKYGEDLLKSNKKMGYTDTGSWEEDSKNAVVNVQGVPIIIVQEIYLTGY